MVDVVTQSLVEIDGKPALKHESKQNLTIEKTYTRTQQLQSVTHEDHTIEYKVYDERDLLIAESGVKRSSENPEGHPIALTPVSICKRDSHGQTVATALKGVTELKGDEVEGFTLISDDYDESKPDKVPDPIKRTATSVIETYDTIMQRDARGLVRRKQNALRHQEATTYTASKKIARQLNEMSTWHHQENNHYDPEKHRQKHVDEQCIRYDSDDRPVTLTLMRDGKITQRTES